ncbi:hypothetical protein [Microbulbifer taiwanensis]
MIAGMTKGFEKIAGETMYGLMMQSQLTLTGIMRHAQNNFSA